MQVQKIQCARVYHINVVLRIRTSVQDTRKDKAYKEKSLQIQRSDNSLLILPRGVYRNVFVWPGSSNRDVEGCLLHVAISAAPVFSQGQMHFGVAISVACSLTTALTRLCWQAESPFFCDCRARIIMDQSGIKRLEATDDSVHLSADRHAVSPGSVWRPDVHMSAMHLPRMSMLRMPTFGRHSAVPAADEANNRDSTMLSEVRSDAKNPAKELVEAV